MGNSMVLLVTKRTILRLHSAKEKNLKILKADGKVLEYRTPVIVGDLLSNFDGHRVGVSQKSQRHLPSDYELKVGRVYYLLPLDDPLSCPSSPKTSVMAKVEEEVDGGKRIKIVLTKQQFQELLLSKKMTLEDMLSGIQKRVPNSCGSWRPRLETILEGNDE